METFKGSPREIGRAYGKAFADRIIDCVNVLIDRIGYEPIPLGEPVFEAWAGEQEQMIKAQWPWLLEEMRGVAEGVGVDYHKIVLLNLRAWQYNFYGAPPSNACSSIAITLADGSVACAGAFDEDLRFFLGPIRVLPDSGYSYITFPLPGTSWCSRVVNSAGLAIGISSQLLPNLRRLKHAMNQDVAMRAITQTCATVGEVREFCQKHPFTLNLVCVDRQGGVFAAQNTAAGLYETAHAAPCVLTNHVVSDEMVRDLANLGVSEFPPVLSSRERRGSLLAFGRQFEGKATADQVKDYIRIPRKDDAGSTCHPNSGMVSYANPKAEPGSFWIAMPKTPGEDKCTKYDL